jgi:hypothetical protein
MDGVYQTSRFLESLAMKKLMDVMDVWHRDVSNSGDFRRFEKDLRDAMSGLERTIVAEAMAVMDVDKGEIEVNGALYEKAYRSSQTYCGMAGEFTIERNLYTPMGKKGASICPLDYRAGIIENTWTPSAGELMAYAVAVMTPYEAERLFKKFGGMSPSRSSLERLPKPLSDKWEENRVLCEETLRGREVFPREAVTVAVSLDGVMVPMKDGQRLQKREHARNKGKETRGPAGCQESGCGTVSLYDDEGERLKTTYYGRMPESKKGTLAAQLDNELACVLAMNPAVKIALIADGAKDNWRILREIIDNRMVEGFLTDTRAVFEIADYYHACEHLKTATDLYYGEGSIKSRSCFEELRITLRDEDNGVEQVIQKIAYFRNRCTGKRRKSLSKEVKYFRVRKLQMNYAEFARLNLPIGSGVVEAACKTLVTQRMKRSGMRWTINGGQAVLTLRGILQSNRWDTGWDLISKSYKAEIRTIKQRGHLALIENLGMAA